MNAGCLPHLFQGPLAGSRLEGAQLAATRTVEAALRTCVALQDYVHDSMPNKGPNVDGDEATNDNGEVGLWVVRGCAVVALQRYVYLLMQQPEVGIAATSAVVARL